jgi:phosphate transport system substrate-binding protein
MKRSLVIALAVAGLVMIGLAGSSILARKSVTIKGSDTMIILCQRWAEDYMKANPDQIVQVTGGGSGIGIAALINGTTDIAQSSRPMKQSEKDKLRDRYNSLGVEIPVAMDGITIYVNEKNPLAELTLDQIKQIYTGKTVNWKELGGADMKIILYGRENSSGTYSFFKDNVLMGADYAPQTQTLPGTAAVVNAVSKDENGIGYGGAAYAKGIKEVKVKKDANSPALAPTLETIQDGSYPISRELFWYTRIKPTGDAKKFLDYVLSPKGQEVVNEVGYFPLVKLVK